jgi:hypothetical protein
MSSLLEGMKARAAARSRRTIRLSNPEDAGQVFVCRVPTDGMELDRLQSAAEKADKGRGANVHFCRAVVAACVESIEDGGQVLEIGGVAVNFRDPELQDALSVPSAKDAVVALIGTDGVIVGLANKLIEEAGYSDSDAFSDPTQG